MTTENIIPENSDLATLLDAVLGDGREVRFVKDPDGSGDYFADVDTVDAGGKPVIHTGIADTALGALEAAAAGMARYAGEGAPQATPAGTRVRILGEDREAVIVAHDPLTGKADIRLGDGQEVTLDAARLQLLDDGPDAGARQ